VYDFNWHWPSIDIKTGATVSGPNASIFYPKSSNTAGAAVPGKTYEWDANADGSGGAGWKATT
jgi:hypothetical protein